MISWRQRGPDLGPGRSLGTRDEGDGNLSGISEEQARIQLSSLSGISAGVGCPGDVPVRGGGGAVPHARAL